MAEQRLNSQYLGTSLIERACAIAIIALGIGAAILLAAWGISRMWHFVPPELSVRIANPELHLADKSQVTVTQEKPFTVVQDKPFTITQADTQKPDVFKPSNPLPEKTPTGDVIRREVTVFFSVRHGPGSVMTGWTYSDGRGGTPRDQFCYYTVPNGDLSHTRIEIASNGNRYPNIGASLISDLEGALAKCQWSQPLKLTDWNRQ